LREGGKPPLFASASEVETLRSQGQFLIPCKSTQRNISKIILVLPYPPGWQEGGSPLTSISKANVWDEKTSLSAFQVFRDMAAVSFDFLV